jgi:hypothetical protein
MARMRKPTDLALSEKPIEHIKRELAEVTEVLNAVQGVYEKLFYRVEPHDVYYPLKRFKSRLLYYMLKRFQSGVERIINHTDAHRINLEEEIARRKAAGKKSTQPDIIKF